MESLLLLILIIAGSTFLSKLERKRRSRVRRRLELIWGLAAESKALETKVESRLDQVLTLVEQKAREKRRRPADRVPIDKIVIYTKQVIGRYYDARSGRLFEEKGPPELLMASEREITPRDLATLVEPRIVVIGGASGSEPSKKEVAVTDYRPRKAGGPLPAVG